MKLSTKLGVTGRHAHLSWEAGAYDGIPPVPNVHVNARFRALNRDREAVALALVYHGFLSGPLEFVNSCSPSVGARIEAFFLPRRVDVKSLELLAKALPLGTRDLWLGSSAAYASLNGLADLQMDFVNDQAFGSSLSVRLLAIASNVGALYRIGTDSAQLARLGVAIMFAEDYSVRSITMPVADNFLQSSSYSVQKLRALCGSVNIRLDLPCLDNDVENDLSHFKLFESPHQAMRSIPKRNLEIIA
ncbi:hypothetical protein [Sphingobium cupriresistens]|uniref:hypothetical protein n=1 Tax=Sphingobium cupriresistens TaxID=1132417 RepID=UPI000A55AB39|nr:hypothetical protein [Sphingobium cupriresistens]